MKAALIPVTIGILSLFFTSHINIRQIIIPVMIILWYGTFYILNKKESTKKDYVFFAIASYLIIHINIFAISNIQWNDYLGVFIWGLSYYLTINFVLNNKSKKKEKCFSRHTEILAWLGFYFMAITVPFGFATIIAPVVIYFKNFKSNCSSHK